MSVIIFLIILSALIVVHELGHFLAARKFGIRVDEFGLGYPPLAKKLFKWKGADFTLNWLPFGGFVKIYGESPTEENAKSPESFQSKNRGIQAAVLVAGVFFNFLFAWLLISLGFMTGIPSPAGMDLPLTNPHTVITLVVPGSPAALAGFKVGDVIRSFTPEEATSYIKSSAGPIRFDIQRGKEILQKTVTPETGILPGTRAIGISMETIGTVRLPPHKALWQGLKTASALTWLTGKAIGTLISQAVLGRADLTAVTGPVGIVGMVGEIRQLGLSYLVTFTALLSINLSIINLLPFPALDGGRLVFVAIESATRKKIPPRFFNAVNAMGFALLIFLMILITVRDVRNIF
ncbi:MAG: hypothetical protein A3J09_00450 [Candidatus Zambryskibacteria bacterium RIFCSPLOWO2_02_FULL_51_21]|uniref:PDZ domain-containing protein n=1 Tax=Candidatus Zambryskibacteria bacterium RIFCSPHIGHO2_02_FULL_43_37 TaxID=1802749 RepID=A0A1G2TI99_9BACT|nr:MAG: hypothetical protein A2723_00450 [Candidatus Zambryskibacteria bacterium RIFCSPHIGHO2_01_FULL_52_18]OHA96923.1 MAG: hypothetical protein A3D49_02350 [Candidatus Zambryskibacteria bacterium RIFCSPHIGHO2_02_FULL_43_37]OHB06704.1 MAG: hypothetical protein A2944_02540 [Candidatus Zambryskibacteria bacterium RIFCSPLOWO2_01_FULL_52_12]OHB11036.1 MAG: hypothetical protein A3J09_00450 [Candidatus Zambryskibacteria bacterium RIFCSPLOWO2_02_FULL_51_21]